MTRKIMIMVSGTALALAGCGKHDQANDNYAAGNAADVNVAATNEAAAASPLSAQGFVNTAAASDKFEIETSKLADLIILSDDIFTIDPVKIWNVKVLTTVVDGKVVYEAK